MNWTVSTLSNRFPPASKPLITWNSRDPHMSACQNCGGCHYIINSSSSGKDWRFQILGNMYEIVIHTHSSTSKATYFDFELKANLLSILDPLSLSA